MEVRAWTSAQASCQTREEKAACPERAAEGIDLTLAFIELWS